MKHSLFSMLIVSTITILSLNSCSKDDSLPHSNNNGGGSPLAVTLNLTASHWEAKGDRVFVNIFKDVIPAENANHGARIYVVTNGKEMLINQPITFMEGALWGTCSQTDVAINYRGDWPSFQYLNIKVVIE